MEQAAILTPWYEYISEQYSVDNSGDIPRIDGINGEPITHSEVEAALKILPMNKSPGTDITAVMIVAAGHIGLTEFVKLSNMI